MTAVQRTVKPIFVKPNCMVWLHQKLLCWCSVTTPSSKGSIITIVRRKTALCSNIARHTQSIPGTLIIRMFIEVSMISMHLMHYSELSWLNDPMILPSLIDRAIPFARKAVRAKQGGKDPFPVTVLSQCHCPVDRGHVWKTFELSSAKVQSTPLRNCRGTHTVIRIHHARQSYPCGVYKLFARLIHM